MMDARELIAIAESVPYTPTPEDRTDRMLDAYNAARISSVLANRHDVDRLVRALGGSVTWRPVR